MESFLLRCLAVVTLHSLTVGLLFIYLAERPDSSPGRGVDPHRAESGFDSSPSPLRCTLSQVSSQLLLPNSKWLYLQFI